MRPCTTILADLKQLQNLMDVDLNFPRADDEDLILPQAEAFPPMASQAPPGGTGFLRSSAGPRDESSSSEAAVARQQRKPRGLKILPVDQPQELRNTILAQWNTDYLANMEEAKRSKLQRKSTADAKHNAAFWVFGSGIGGVGVGRGVSNTKSPLADIFSGEALMRALTGAPTSAVARKRNRSEDEGDGSDGSEERRVKMREAEDEVGRSQGLNLEDDDTMALPGSEVSPPSLLSIPNLERETHSGVHRQSRWVGMNNQH